MSNSNEEHVTQGEGATAIIAAGVLATLSWLLWIRITQSGASLPVSASSISLLTWLGLFFVLWPATSYLGRRMGRRWSLQAAFAFLPVGLVFLVPGAWVIYEQHRSKGYEQSILQTYAVADEFVTADSDQKTTAAEIASGGSLSAYVTRIRPDGALPLGIQRALDAIAASGTPALRHQIVAAYTSDYNLMRTIASSPQADAGDLRTIFEYYNNSYAYQPGAERANPHRTVLICLAKNPQTPQDILVTLFAGPERGTVMDNPNLPGNLVTEDLEKKIHGDIYERISVAASRRATEAILVQLASDPDRLVRMQVATNSKTPGDVLVKLFRDEDWQVARVARSILFHLIDSGDASALHATALSRSNDDQLMITVACQENTTEVDLEVIYRQFGSQPTDSVVKDSLSKCLDKHPKSYRGRLVSLLH